MIPYFKKIVLLLLTLSFVQNVYSQKAQENKTISLYFQERITNYPNEDFLVPFGQKIKLKTKDIDDVTSKVWQLWIESNERIERLPAAEQFPFNTIMPPLYKWDLIDEDPLPFFYINKGEIGEKTNRPLFLNLHGSGPKTMEFRAALEWSLQYADSPSAYFIPQIPNEARYRWWLKPVQYAWEKLFRLAMVDPQIDPNQIFVLGISEGGYGSQRLGAYYADYLAGAGPMAGGEPLHNAPPFNYRHVPLSLQTGENDSGFGRNKLTALAANAFDSLSKEYPGDFIHNIVLQAGRGHSIDYTQTTPWLIKHKRTPNPKHISWVHFPMDGRYRKGFYNIAFEQPLAIKEGDELDRAFFDIHFDRSENTIRIEAFLTDPEGKKSADISTGKISIYLDNDYVDLNKKVKIIYNNQTVAHTKLGLKEDYLIESCALFGDPYRLFPAKVTVNL